MQNSLYFSLLGGNSGQRRVRPRLRPPPTSLLLFIHLRRLGRNIDFADLPTTVPMPAMIKTETSFRMVLRCECSPRLVRFMSCLSTIIHGIYVPDLIEDGCDANDGAE
jgi:hypothetical protein